MKRRLLKSKIHRATVTGADVHYEGSIALDTRLMEAAELAAFEQIDIYNCNNGERFHTYVIPGQRGEVCLNGAAARKVMAGDVIILCTYAEFEDNELQGHQPTVVFVDATNAPTKIEKKHT